jgi:hypothetical protein
MDPATVMQIFHLKDHLLFNHPTHNVSRTSELVATVFNISTKAVRDIWAGRTWCHLTGVVYVQPVYNAAGYIEKEAFTRKATPGELFRPERQPGPKRRKVVPYSAVIEHNPDDAFLADMEKAVAEKPKPVHMPAVSSEIDTVLDKWATESLQWVPEGAVTGDVSLDSAKM